MELNEVMDYLQQKGSEQIRRIFAAHGAPVNKTLGVKIGDLKPLVKTIKKDHELSLALYNTGISDAMYLAGLIADEKKISKIQLQQWVKMAQWEMISEYTVAWIAAESPYGMELALEWIDSDKEEIQASGWSTLSSWVSIRKDEDLDLKTFEKLLKRVEKNIHGSPNRTRYAMNGFVISLGSYVLPLNKSALETATKIGNVEVIKEGTSCKVPDAAAYIKKVMNMGKLGKKKKMARC